MSKLLLKLWNDDCGALISMELLFIATILIIGIGVGLQSLKEAINVELVELGNAILALSQTYTFSGQTGCCASTEGSATFDTPGRLPDIICVPPAPAPIDSFLPCF